MMMMMRERERERTVCDAQVNAMIKVQADKEEEILEWEEEEFF